MVKVTNHWKQHGDSQILQSYSNNPINHDSRICEGLQAGLSTFIQSHMGHVKCQETTPGAGASSEWPTSDLTLRETRLAMQIDTPRLKLCFLQWQWLQNSPVSFGDLGRQSLVLGAPYSTYSITSVGGHEVSLLGMVIIYFLNIPTKVLS